MKDKAKKYENEITVVLSCAIVCMQRENPDYGEADAHIQRALDCMKYARECNNGTFRGEPF